MLSHLLMHFLRMEPLMAEGNAGVYDFDAIRKELQARGYRPVWHTERTAQDQSVCPETGPCYVKCNAGTAEGCPLNCRLRHLS